MLTIRKGNQQKQITEAAWDLIGENKNGWSIVTEDSAPVVNEIVAAPPTGEPETPADNTAVTNEVVFEETAAVVNEIATTNETSEADPASSSENTPDDFTEHVLANISKQKVKDYLDQKEIAYKANSSLAVLAGILKNELQGDVELLKLEFSLGL